MAADPRDRSRTLPVAGRFALLDQIGQGGMGSVWRAVDLRDERVVAVKIVGRHDGALLARFVREQAVRIRHPHVVCAQSWAAEDDLVLLAMDLVEGGTVADLISRTGPLPPAVVAVILEQTLRGLAAVHAAGLVHRDIKPANLLLEATGDGPLHVRLADFGVACAPGTNRMTTVPGSVGTRGWAAPEQLAGAVPAPAQDLYAVGRVAQCLLSGVTPSATPDAALTADTPLTPLHPLLERLLAPDPAHRIASAEAALGLLERLAASCEPFVSPAVPARLAPLPDARTQPRAAARVLRRHGAGRATTSPVGTALSWLAVAACLTVLALCGASLLGLWP